MLYFLGQTHCINIKGLGTKTHQTNPRHYYCIEIMSEGEQQEVEAAAASYPVPVPDPLSLDQRSDVIREGDHVILIFGDGKQSFAQCLKSWKGKSAPAKINKRSYPTANLIGLPYGTVLELGSSSLKPLPQGEGLIPKFPAAAATADGDTNHSGTNSDACLNGNGKNDDDSKAVAGSSYDSTVPPAEQATDNRHLVDNNTSQSLHHDEVKKLQEQGIHGSDIVKKLIKHSASFQNKTDFSKAKYVLRKQKKYQPRCRVVRCTAATICEALFFREPRRLMNMRDDTLGQILSYANISAGCQPLIFETCLGVVTGAAAERMGGYGRICSVYSGQQPAFTEMLSRFNLSFAENNAIKWVHSGDVFGGEIVTSNEPEAVDPDRVEREALEWPCALQDHTRTYMEKMKTEKDQNNFLAKRCARFARKLTRHTDRETSDYLKERKCDCVIIATKFDPTATLLELLPYLAPSSPFVVYSEFIEPLTECFKELQAQSLAINLRLSDTWTREYQVLPGRTHPNMTMSQSGGFILTGIKLCPVTGQNELDEDLIKEIRSTIGGRRGKKKNNQDGSRNNKKRKASGDRDAKKQRT